MRVLVDATAIPANRGGVGRYLDELLAALSGGVAAAAGIELAVVHRPTDRFLPALPVDTVAAPDWPGRQLGRLAWEQAGLPGVVRRMNAAVLHSPHYTVPIAAGVPVVVTMHDATFFSHPEWHSRVKGPFFRAWTKTAARRAAWVVVPSRATRGELVRAVGLDQQRVTVAHHGVDHSTFHPPASSAAEALRARLALAADEQYLAFLGTLEPRKNVPALIRGWVRACAHRDRPPALVLAGARGWDSGIEAAVREVPAGLRLITPGYLPLTELAALLGGAVVVAYPSLGEGFGLPVLEAMACGAAVLTTRRLALPEVGGDAVAYCDPDAASIGRRLGELLDSPGERTALADSAVSRAGQFSWQQSAQHHVKAYLAAAQCPVRGPR